MSDTSAFGFGKFVPGFDFLKNLAQSSQQAQPGMAAAMPNMGNWVAPTLSIEELDKRIQELKAVQFWLDQNATALKATIQAMEVQKMTLSTLQGMNVNMADLAKAFTASVPSAAAAFTSAPVASAAPPAAAAVVPEPVKQPEPAAVPPEAGASAEAAASEAPAAAKPAVDPMQWWGSLTEQFQNIAAAALKDVAAQALKDAPKTASKKTTSAGSVHTNANAGAKATASSTASPRASATAKKTTARKVPAMPAAKKATTPRKRA
jgi:hypothetical protein